MKRMITLTLAFLVFVLGSCNLWDNKSRNIPEIELDEKSTQLVQAGNEFGLELFQRIASGEEENVMISPLSISVALAMAYNGADGDTRAEMEQTLKVAGLTTEQINDSYAYLIDALQSLDEDVVFELANAIFYEQSFPVKDEFTDVNKEVYDAEVAGVDFSSPAALEAINGWVSDKTHKKIPKILDVLNPLDRLVLLNAVYFNGIWKTRFDEEGTHDLPFTRGDGSVTEVPMMNKEDDVAYTSTSLFRAIRMPYGNGQYSMVVFLPEQGFDPDDIIDACTPAEWKAWMNSFQEDTPLNITMPRFKYRYELELKDVLKEMGMVEAFSDKEADFSKISDVFLYISRILHKTYIDVNENGTEAAAVTAVVFTTTSAGGGGVPAFTVDRPFVYAITEKDTGAILFMGKVVDPVYED
jgi:serine protease inhibitor